eukprot:1142139-Pelagomonas_calceolata.AAC.8
MEMKLVNPQSVSRASKVWLVSYQQALNSKTSSSNSISPGLLNQARTLTFGKALARVHLVHNDELESSRGGQIGGGGAGLGCIQVDGETPVPAFGEGQQSPVTAAYHKASEEGKVLAWQVQH